MVKIEQLRVEATMKSPIKNRKNKQQMTWMGLNILWGPSRWLSQRHVTWFSQASSHLTSTEIVLFILALMLALPVKSWLNVKIWIRLNTSYKLWIRLDIFFNLLNTDICKNRNVYWVVVQWTGIARPFCNCERFSGHFGSGKPTSKCLEHHPDCLSFQNFKDTF